MKSQQPPKAPPVLHLEQVQGERWTWRYVEEAFGLELNCNETYGSREAAVQSARLAYPGVSFADADADADADAETEPDADSDTDAEVGAEAAGSGDEVASGP